MRVQIKWFSGQTLEKHWSKVCKLKQTFYQICKGKIIIIISNIQGYKDVERLSFSYTAERKVNWQNNSEGKFGNTYQKPF